MSESDTLPDPLEGFDFRDNTRELILSKLLEAIEYLHKKSLKGQIKKPANERVRVSYFKALCHACSVYNQISQNLELDELKDDLERLRMEIKEDKGVD